MSTETEAKLRVDSHEPIRQRLQAAGATLIGKVLETNVILDRSDGSLRRAGSGVRVRTTRSESDNAATTVLTYKGPVEPGEFKRREELEVEVSDAANTLKMFERLDFKAILRYEKRRETWALGDCLVELDEPPHIGLFIEIEGPDEAAINRLKDQLGLASVQHEKASYVRMLLRYCREHALPEPVLALP